ncbi:hypothetical protein JOB18_005709 [Solea senegalensis]|uniref:Uncharacterized protein n=1 Tax=Solea senegalensis TaxID=28829 RepID=A0AAV6QJP0_SOLSE|nr:hypothetical protein JOB18_005709 [Solea senegalensis]
MKHALERILQYAPGGDIHNGPATEKIHYGTCPPQALSDMRKVSGSCKVFPTNENLICKSIQYPNPSAPRSLNRLIAGFVQYKSLLMSWGKYCGVICVVNSMLLLLMPPSVLLSTPFVLLNKM